MSDLEHLYLLRTKHKQRLQEREIQQAHYGASADPSIPNEIKRIKSELAELEYNILQEWLNLFKRYEYGFDRLLSLLSQRNPHRHEALTDQQQLIELMKFVREGGDGEAKAVECELLVKRINDLAIENTGSSFYELCGISPGASASNLPPPAQPPLQPSRPATPTPGAAGIAIGSIDAQNVVFGNQTNIGTIVEIKTNNVYSGPKPQSDDRQE